jgi:hypothetical protein
MKMLVCCAGLVYAMVPAGPGAQKQATAAEIVGVARIWDRAPHNAFTDLLRYKDRWFCVFREGTAHVSADGGVRVLTSFDGETWIPAAVISYPGADLRDPKLAITPGGDLMLTSAAAMNPPSSVRHQTLVWFSSDGREWTPPRPIGDPDMWLWRVTWHRDHAYSVGYSTGETRFVRLYASRDGRRFLPHADNLLVRGYPNESAIVFRDDESAVCLLRRDQPQATAQVGISRPPYRGWQWRDLGVRIGGPNLIRLADDRLLVAARFYVDGKPNTSLAWLSAEDATLEPFLTLPSGGDSSYPGLVYHDGLLWVSYYSSHEGKSNIYMARIKVPAQTRRDRDTAAFQH